MYYILKYTLWFAANLTAVVLLHCMSNVKLAALPIRNGRD